MFKYFTTQVGDNIDYIKIVSGNEFLKEPNYDMITKQKLCMPILMYEFEIFFKFKFYN